jgi:hypothetical protein
MSSDNASKDAYALFRDYIGITRCAQEPGLCVLVRNIFERSVGVGISSILHSSPSSLTTEDSTLNFLCSVGETASFDPNTKDPRYPSMYRFSSDSKGEIYFRWQSRSKQSRDMLQSWACVNDIRRLSSTEQLEADGLLDGTTIRDDSSSTIDGASREVLRVGTRVKARYGWESSWFDATIKEVRNANDGRSDQKQSSEPLYALQYDDGDVEEDVKRLKIRLEGEKQKRELSAGQEVDACCQHYEEKVLPGVVTGPGINEGEYLVRFDLNGLEIVNEGDEAVFEESIPRNRIFGPYSAPMGDISDGPVSKGSSKNVVEKGSIIEAGRLCHRYVSSVVPSISQCVLALTGEGSRVEEVDGLALGSLSHMCSEDRLSNVFIYRYRSVDMMLGTTSKDVDSEGFLGR